MIKINQIKLPVTHSDEALKKKIIKMLKLNAKTGFTYRILKKSLDARKKPELFYTYSVAVEIEDTKLIGGSRFGAIGLFRPADHPGDTRFDPFTSAHVAIDPPTM